MTEFESCLLGNSDVRVSRLGIGTVPLAGFKAKVSYAEAETLVKGAFDAGIRHFDCAPFYGYGKAEYNLGHALRELGIRENVVVSTKVGRVLKAASQATHIDTAYGIDWVEPLPFLETYDYTYDGVMRSFEDSQKRLAMDYIDILLVHDLGTAWFGDDADIYWNQMREGGGFRALEALRSGGSVGAVGLGVNETASVITAAREFDLDCALIAGRYTLLNHGPLQSDFDELQRLNVSVIAAGIFNSGILATGVKGGDDATYDYGKTPDEIVEKVGKIEAICASHGVSLPAAAIQYVNSHPAVASVVLGAASAEQVNDNVTAWSENIPDALWSDLKSQGLLPVNAPVPTA